MCSIASASRRRGTGPSSWPATEAAQSTLPKSFSPTGADTIMKLVHLSDVHIHGEPVGDSDPVERFRLCLAHVEKHFSDADAIVVTGDLTHDGQSASYERLRQLLDATALKFHLLLGNHDHRGRFRAAFKDHPADENGFIQYVADAGGHRLIMLDTCEPGTHAGHLCEKRLGWLSERLGEARRDATPVL